MIDQDRSGLLHETMVDVGDIWQSIW